MTKVTLIASYSPVVHYGTNVHIFSQDINRLNQSTQAVHPTLLQMRSTNLQIYTTAHISFAAPSS
jgi:hypothetical protein